jgi:hypothetical protein
VENPIHPGTPDVNLCTGLWIELKTIDRWPARARTSVRLRRYTPQQRVWLFRRWKYAPGTTFLLLEVRSAEQWLLFDGDVAAKVVGRATTAEHRLNARAVLSAQGIDELPTILAEVHDEFIDVKRSADPSIFAGNGVRKGKPGKPHSAETRAKISAAQKGKFAAPPSAETRAKISAANKGKLSGDANPMKRPEVRAKMVASSTGIKRARTSAHNAKIAAAHLGRPKHTAESRARLREVALSRPPMSAEARAKCAAASRRRWGHRD